MTDVCNGDVVFSIMSEFDFKAFYYLEKSVL
jgi:hypothetical protein